MLTGRILALFISAAVLQVAGMSILPSTQGFTKPWPAVIVLICYALALLLMAKLIHEGVNLSILMPFLAGTIPLLTILVGIFYYGEAASVARIATLLAATGLVAVATRL